MLSGLDSTAIAVGSFSDGEYTFGKPRRACQHFANARDFDNVYAYGNDHRVYRINRRRLLLARA